MHRGGIGALTFLGVAMRTRRHCKHGVLNVDTGLLRHAWTYAQQSPRIFYHDMQMADGAHYATVVQDLVSLSPPATEGIFCLGRDSSDAALS
jgi:hypothetical protein